MVIDLFRFSISSCVTFWGTYPLEKWSISFSLQRCWDKIVSNLKLLICIIKQQKFNQVHFKALTGFIEQLMNQVASHLPSRNSLGGAEQKGRRLQAEGGGGGKERAGYLTFLWGMEGVHVAVTSLVPTRKFQTGQLRPLSWGILKVQLGKVPSHGSVTPAQYK